MNIEDVFPDGKWMSDEEFLIQCPICGDHFDHNHCYVNIKKENFFCHYTGCKGHISRILYEDIDLKPRQKAIQEEVEEIDFSQFPKVTGTEGFNDKMALTYLKSRGLNKDDIDTYDIRYASSGRFFGRVLVPIYEDKRLVCFVGRGFLHFIEPKYLFPRKRQTVLTISEAIFGYDKVFTSPRKRVYLTEGVFDAMAVDKKLGGLGLALLTKHMSDRQLYKLVTFPSDISFWVLFDSDAQEEAVKVAGKLRAWGREAMFVPLEEGDPASVDQEILAEALRLARPYSEELESRVILGG
jgi:hypothetical protein